MFEQYKFSYLHSGNDGDDDNEDEENDREKNAHTHKYMKIQQKSRRRVTASLIFQNQQQPNKTTAKYTQIKYIYIQGKSENYAQSK